MLKVEATTDGAYEQHQHSISVAALHCTVYESAKADEEPARVSLAAARATEAAIRQELRLEVSPTADDSEDEGLPTDEEVIIKILARVMRTDNKLVRIEQQMANAAPGQEAKALFAQREQLKAGLEKVCANLQEWNESFGKVAIGGSASNEQFIAHTAAKASTSIITKIRATEAAWVAAAAAAAPPPAAPMQVDGEVITDSCQRDAAAGTSAAASGVDVPAAANTDNLAAAATAAATATTGRGAESKPPSYVPQPQPPRLAPGFIKTWEPQPPPTAFEGDWNTRDRLAADRAARSADTDAPFRRGRSERSRSALAGKATFPDAGSESCMP
jgi:hypothetical protein